MKYKKYCFQCKQEIKKGEWANKVDGQWMHSLCVAKYLLAQQPKGGAA
jgi:hypothetical protein